MERHYGGCSCCRGICNRVKPAIRSKLFLCFIFAYTQLVLLTNACLLLHSYIDSNGVVCTGPPASSSRKYDEGDKLIVIAES